MSSLVSLNILLADDSQPMRALIGALLHSAGVRTIREAADGGAAYALLKRHPIDLAIIDFNMLPMDGVAFTQRVRTAPDSPNAYLPIIMMTSHSAASRVFEARDAGVTEFVAKPITAKAVLDRINAAIFKPRPFVRTDAYFGPSRRRRDIESYSGPFRRASDAKR
ncbi:response regulator [Brevundimonas sp. SORGH_AS_0993]|uniref:response regulator n=1 Tax=Brevundimonas sp. SORGH_AS_0993 TaxID=3041794 RepID=UPI0027843E80|nr:response regulator [Brevundimonas sp. SORGH_AS_0993]MDQ1155611.1 two-component system chemotaxis response regulator CheY [Brevundimonas sp. SORGH_AS_0993]